MERLARLAAAHGVDTVHAGGPGPLAEVPPDTVVAVLAALGVDASTPQAVRAALERHERDARLLLPPTVVLRAGGGTLPALPEGTALHVELEDGRPLHWAPGTPLPFGAHRLSAQAPDGRAAHATLLHVPDRFPAPAGHGPHGRSFGLLLQLYSLLSSRSWGMGDLGDLADLAEWAGRDLGAGFVQLGPLHAAVPGAPTDPSPYRPSSRRFPDPVHLRVTDVPEFAALPPEAREQADRLLARAAELREGVLRKDALIDRDAVWELKQAALRLVCDVPLAPARRAAYEDYRAARGRSLEDHATWCVLAELHGPDHHAWPPGLEDPRSARTAAARAAHPGRVDFHRRLAWLTEEQLAAAQATARAAGMPVGLVHDLAIGVHPTGADTWALPGAFARGISVGAPPDAFNARGQDWGLPPWRPDALAACGYAPYREVLAGMLRHSGALRIDHVMGLFRLWWIPEGRPPTEGTYVRYDAEAMLGALALEAHRAGSAVIGEDLGTVEPGVREALASRGMLGTSVLWFEQDWDEASRSGRAAPLPPERWRADCLATATTHDLPPTAARLSGEHLDLRHELGLLDGELAAEQATDAAETAGWLSRFRDLGLLPGPDGDPGRGAAAAAVPGAHDPRAAAPASEAGAGDLALAGVPAGAVEGMPPAAADGGASGGEEEQVRAVHRFLARTPARMVGVWLPDAVGDRRPQNVPGTWAEYPNWRQPVADAEGRPAGLEEIASSPRARALFADLRAAMRGEGQP